MAKRLLVVASGETERLAVPALLREILGTDVVLDVRTARHGKVTPDEAVRIVVSAYWEGHGKGAPLDKAVILTDVDGQSPDTVLEPLRTRVPPRLQSLSVTVLFAHAQWHLEAWFFGDPQDLRSYLGRELGSVDPTRPDEIRNPKLHLRNLLGDVVYTARVSQAIANRLDARRIETRSPSFARFVDAACNGSSD